MEFGVCAGPKSGWSLFALGTLSLERIWTTCERAYEVERNLTARVQTALFLPIKKEAEHIVNTVVASLKTTLLNNLGTDGFALKLNTFDKFYLQHKPGFAVQKSGSGKLLASLGSLAA
jgi:hypothetical protein